MADHGPSIGDLRATQLTNGYPSPAEDFVEQRLVLDRLVTRHGEATFYMQMETDALCDAGVHAGDWLVIDRAEPPRENDLVIVAAQGKLLARRYHPLPAGFVLSADAPGVELIASGADGDVAIWGVVTHFLRCIRP
jgi:DNA polymerase V